MKLFSRKALVAGATAVAVAFAGTSVATAEEATIPSVSSNTLSSSPGTGDEGDNTDNGGSSNEGDGTTTPDNGSSDLGADEIASWISVFTAVIGALAAAFSFATKYLGFKI